MKCDIDNQARTNTGAAWVWSTRLSPQAIVRPRVLEAIDVEQRQNVPLEAIEESDDLLVTAVESETQVPYSQRCKRYLYGKH